MDPARARRILKLLGTQHPNADTELHYRTPFELLVATILSAQSTDQRVNLVTPALFARYPDAAALSRATPAELEPQIHSTGFFRAKGRSLLGMAQALVERHGGQVPSDMNALVELPGVGRKTANVVLGHALGVPGLPVDRHVLRVANRIGLVNSEDPEAVERALCRLLPRKDWTRSSDTLILHGRRVCRPRPLCDSCVIRHECRYVRRLGAGAGGGPARTRPASPGKPTDVATRSRQEPGSLGRARGRIRTSKRLGQNFLEPDWVRKVVEAINPREDETFLEIGPGMGALTVPLAAAARRVVAIEIDSRFAAALRARRIPNVLVVQGNALDEDLELIVDRECTQHVRIVGNLPYYVVTPILFRVVDLARRRRIRDAVLMVQREVADRLVARPGTKEYGVLSVQLAMRGDVERLFNLPPGAFRPVPQVSSSLVRIRFRPDREPVPDQDVFDRMLTALFSRRRKTLLNALKPFAESRGVDAADALARLRIDGRRRPETLGADEFADLAGLFVSA